MKKWKTEERGVSGEEKYGFWRRRAKETGQPKGRGKEEAPGKKGKNWK